MNRAPLSKALLIGVLATGAACASSRPAPKPASPLPAPIVVDVWPGPAPDDIGIDGEERAYIHPSVFVGPTRLITNVTKPTLTIYRPPKERTSERR